MVSREKSTEKKWLTSGANIAQEKVQNLFSCVGREKTQNHCIHNNHYIQ
jgi:hypothetical protein